MGLFTILLVIVVILAIVVFGKTFSSGVITGFDRAVDIGTRVIKDLTQDARDYVNSPEQIRST